MLSRVLRLYHHNLLLLSFFLLLLHHACTSLYSLVNQKLLTAGFCMFRRCGCTTCEASCCGGGDGNEVMAAVLPVGVRTCAAMSEATSVSGQAINSQSVTRSGHHRPAGQAAKTATTKNKKKKEREEEEGEGRRRRRGKKKEAMRMAGWGQRRTSSARRHAMSSKFRLSPCSTPPQPLLFVFIFVVALSLSLCSLPSLSGGSGDGAGRHGGRRAYSPAWRAHKCTGRACGRARTKGELDGGRWRTRQLRPGPDWKDYVLVSETAERKKERKKEREKHQS